MKKFSRDDQRLMAIWALDCAERVLFSFEAARPDDVRPRSAIEAGRDWVCSGQSKMAIICGVPFDAHAAAKDTTNPAAIAAAHAVARRWPLPTFLSTHTEARITRFAPSRHDRLKTSTESAHGRPCSFRPTSAAWRSSRIAIETTKRCTYLVKDPTSDC